MEIAVIITSLMVILLALFAIAVVWTAHGINQEVKERAAHELDRRIRLVDFDDAPDLVIAYDRETGTFMSQGSSKEECVAELVQRWPDRLFITDMGRFGKQDIVTTVVKEMIDRTLKERKAEQ